MNTMLAAIVCVLCLLGAILLHLELGRRVGRRRLQRFGPDAPSGFGAADGAVFALLGLLLAFTFSGAASRFDERRALIVEEANCIGTAYLRLDLLPAAAQPGLRQGFREYVDARLNAYRKLPDIAAARQELARAAGLQNEIWAAAVEGCRGSDSPATTTLVLSAINDMMDIAGVRTAAAVSHPPVAVYLMLLGLTLAGAFLAGHGMAVAEGRDWIHMLCFALVMSAAGYIILDFEFPRFGLIRVDTFDRVLAEVREGMG